MELSVIIPHIEALIFASDKPLTALDIVELINNAFGFMEEKISLDQVEASVEGIREKYSADFYPFEIKESGGGWQFLTKRDYHKTIAQLNGDRFLKRLSNAALETLAIIAYKQPITKGEVEAIRGVNSDYSIQKLLEKDLIIISGRNEELPGKPLIYSTSKSFMDYFGINSADDLPKIKEVLAGQSFIQGTLMSDATNSSENTGEETAENELTDSSTSEKSDVEKENIALIVADNGELLEKYIESNVADKSEEPGKDEPANAKERTAENDSSNDNPPTESTADKEEED